VPSGEARPRAPPGIHGTPDAWAIGMPYSKISDLPEEQVDQYSTHQKHAFLKAFNNALDEYKDEGRAFAVAHSAAQRAPKTDPDEERSS
jgi:cation transport regulator